TYKFDPHMDPNRDGRLDIDGCVWQLSPGRYSLSCTFSGPSKSAGAPAGFEPWKGSIEVPAQRFEVFRDLTPDEWKAEIAQVRSRPFKDAEAKWEALAALITPGMDASQMQQALPPGKGRNFGGW